MGLRTEELLAGITGSGHGLAPGRASSIAHAELCFLLWPLTWADLKYDYDQPTKVNLHFLLSCCIALYLFCRAVQPRTPSPAGHPADHSWQWHSRRDGHRLPVRSRAPAGGPRHHHLHMEGEQYPVDSRSALLQA